MKKKTVNKEIFAKRLTDLMNEFGETTYTMADRFSLTSPTISRYMTGQMAAKITTIELMAKHFNVNPVWLMGYDVDKTLPCFASVIKLSEHENKVIIAYRNQKAMQPAVDRLLGIEPEEEYVDLAKAARGQQPLKLTKEQAKAFAESANKAPNSSQNRDMF